MLFIAVIRFKTKRHVCRIYCVNSIKNIVDTIKAIESYPNNSIISIFTEPWQNQTIANNPMRGLSNVS